MLYTGLMTSLVFTTVFEIIKPAVTCTSITSHYFKMSAITYPSLTGKEICFLLILIFMFLCSLKCGLMAPDLADRFNCHVSTVSSIFLYFALGSITIWPSREQVDRKMPNYFRTLYPTTWVLIDCTEIKTEKPSSSWCPYFCFKSLHRLHVICRDN